MKIFFTLVFAAFSTLNAQLLDKKTLSLDLAKKLGSVVETEARKNNVGGAIAIVDEGGSLVYLSRLDNTFAAASEVSTLKARTAAQFQRPTRVFEDAIKNGRLALTAVPPMLPLQGGVPVIVDGKVIGAIGVSGAASAQQDDDFATIAANAVKEVISELNQPVMYVKSSDVASAFVKGMPLFENGQYKIHASHRDASGMAEVHTRDTDIIYVLEGTATFVTGGTVVDGQVTATDEIRGKEIKDGTTYKLVKGDVMVVPAGTPHWFKEVKAPFNYYVVKATR